MTVQTQLTLRALLAYPGREMYGLQVITATGLRSGVVYPILARFEGRGWLESRWETLPAAGDLKRPPRRYYRLTDDGARHARAALDTAPVPVAGLGLGSP
jgi:PadR family transcriptional regulator, regulatory protein PadR